MGFEDDESEGPPEWYIDHLVAKEYGCTPSDVVMWPEHDFERATIIMAARNKAEKSARLKNK